MVASAAVTRHRGWDISAAAADALACKDIDVLSLSASATDAGRFSERKRLLNSWFSTHRTKRSFDDLVFVAAKACGVPIALITLRHRPTMVQGQVRARRVRRISNIRSVGSTSTKATSLRSSI